MTKQKILVTGGAGFIGANTCARLLADGHEVLVLDNLARGGAASNLAWLSSLGQFAFYERDIRDASSIPTILSEHPDITAVIHLAGQVAVTTSVQNPREDFEINALGTLNLLEALRLARSSALLVFSSTNKVYGEMKDLQVVEDETRYRLKKDPGGISETRGLDFHSPYGCSKGAADQYVRDYARVFDLQTVVFRQSCIYGPRQFGVEDQGWVAWFMIAAALGQPITIYGNGKQVRDVLYVDDLISAYLMAIERRDRVAGRAYNIGGGPANTMSVWTEFGPMLEGLAGYPIPVEYRDWRPGDQPVYVSDISLAVHDLDWRPTISIGDGVGRLYAWINSNRSLLRSVLLPDSSY